MVVGEELADVDLDPVDAHAVGPLVLVDLGVDPAPAGVVDDRAPLGLGRRAGPVDVDLEVGAGVGQAARHRAGQQDGGDAVVGGVPRRHRLRDLDPARDLVHGGHRHHAPGRRRDRRPGRDVARHPDGHRQHAGQQREHLEAPGRHDQAGQAAGRGGGQAHHQVGQPLDVGPRVERGVVGDQVEPATVANDQPSPSRNSPTNTCHEVPSGDDAHSVSATSSSVAPAIATGGRPTRSASQPDQRARTRTCPARGR